MPEIGRAASWYEQALAYAARNDDPEHTLFVQLTRYELLTISFGLMWLGVIYGPEAIEELSEKLHDLVREQEFCDCPNCQRRREEGE